MQFADVVEAWSAVRATRSRKKKTEVLARVLHDAGPALPYSTVSRGDVAATLAEVVNTPQISRMIIELTQGGSSVKDAIQQLIRNK